MPIITHEDELELAKTEKEVVSKIKNLAKVQSAVVANHKKFADSLIKAKQARESLNISLRDTLKQMQTLARESNSNIKDEEVNLFQAYINDNIDYIAANDAYLNAIKDLTIKKEYFIKKKIEFADALVNVANRRATLIKKALAIEKAKNKLIEGEKLALLDQQYTDLQRDFDRARDIMLKLVVQLKQVKDELNALWLKLKEAVAEMS